MSEPSKEIRIHRDVDGHRIGELESDVADLRREIRDLDKRVSRQERFQSFVFGAGAVISGTAAWILKGLLGDK